MVRRLMSTFIGDNQSQKENYFIQGVSFKENKCNQFLLYLILNLINFNGYAKKEKCLLINKCHWP
ncbi:hypothetical protein CR513_05255, partial [Mucuna pruriens]